MKNLWKCTYPTLSSHKVGKVIITSTPPNSNGRIYPKDIFMKEIERYQKRIKRELRIKKLNRINGRRI